MRVQLNLWLYMTVAALSVSNRVIGQCLPEQKALLLQLRNNLNYSSYSTKLSQWDETIDCCDWRGVQCDNGGRVIGLDLSSDSIFGTIPDSSSLFRLRFLQRLSLAGNYFKNSSVPTGFEKLTELKYLNLSATGFEGQIPDEFSRLSMLVALDLSTYEPPSRIQLLKLENPNLKMLVQNLTKLRELHLDGVDISSQGPDWSQVLSSSVPDLQVLSLSFCNISYPPDTSLAKLQSLSVIRLDGNSFFAPIPDFFGGFHNLTVLSLRGCNLLGKTPQKIFQISTLKTIDLSNNRELGGSLPEFPHNGSLQILTLSYTSFSGSLPESMGSLKMLNLILMIACNFSGPIPRSVSNLSHLGKMDLSQNQFTGSLPTFSKSKSLSALQLAHNKLTGNIPPEWEGLENLRFLELAYNSLSGFLPPFLFALPSVEGLVLPNNQFSLRLSELEDVSPSPRLLSIELTGNNLEGPFPEFLYNIGTLERLLLSSNKLMGPVDLIKFAGFRHNLTNILHLSHNNLSVRVSGSDSDFSLLPKFSVLMLASCKLQSVSFLKNQSSLYMLDISENQITGDIPNWLWELNSGYLPFLNLSHNEFTGLQEPYRFGEHKYLDLHSNLLKGQIPLPPLSAVFVDFSSNKFASSMPADIGNHLTSAVLFNIADSGVVGDITPLCKASYLQVLDLSNNDLSGSIPSCLMEMSRTLKVLNLQHNKLSGNVPSTFPQDCGLETLDLGYNLLEGLVPQSLISCSTLKILNLGSNRISDLFPCWSKNLPDLHVLVLHSNSFHGEIICPEGENGWPNLQIIDIASNSFRGVLPPNLFSDLTAITVSYDESSLQLNNLYYGSWSFPNFETITHLDPITINYKGNPLEVVKILSALTFIDLSNNNFYGRIPETVGKLRSLRHLNLSSNAITAQIPPSIGNLTQLESLDLSFNKLTGEIPQQLASLTFLTFLNLSYNQLDGRIPTGRQLQTFPESSFEGNEGLVGFPLKPVQPTSEEKQWQHLNVDVYVSSAIGFFVGLGIIFWPLWISEKWRNRYNYFFDGIISRIFDQPSKRVRLNKSR